MGDARILPDFLTLNRVEQMIKNAATSMSRQALAADSMDDRRNLNKECGYPESGSLEPKMLSDLVDREPVANRVVGLMPDECWVVQPEVYEDEDEKTTTEFEEALDNVANGLRGPSWYKGNEGNPLWEYLHRIDTLCGIGWFGILLIGLDDGKQLNEAVDGVDDKGESASKQPKERKLLFLRAFDQSLVQISRWEDDITNPRYGQPVTYLVTLSDPKEPMQTGVGLNQSTVEVHWHRVLHVADNLKSSEVFGVPRCRPVLNPLLDIRKVRGASAEMYWKGGFSGFALTTHPQLGGDVKINAPRLRQQMENYQNSLQRYLILMGMSPTPLAPTVVDPTPQIQAQIDAICIQLKTPVRIFMGSERGELASSQDDQTWNDRLSFRQCNHLTPRLIVPFVDRLVVLGVLPQPEQYYVRWPDLNALSDAEKATIAKTRTEALQLYVSGQVESMMAPMDYLTRELGYDKEEAEEIIEGVVEHLGKSNPETEDEIMPGHVPSPPEPEPEPGAPVKVREGEHLFTPEGKKLAGVPSKPTTNEEADQNTVPFVGNWNPGQPRDARGRWSSGGGSGVPSTPTTRSEWRKSLPEGQKKAVQDYVEDSEIMTGVERKLAAGESLTDVESSDLDNFYAALESAPEYDGPMFRGTRMSIAARKQLLASGEVSLDTTQSYSKKREVAYDFAKTRTDATEREGRSKPILFKVAKGRAADISGITGDSDMEMFRGNAEVVVKPGTRYKIVKTSFDNIGGETGTVVHLEEIVTTTNWNPGQPRDSAGRWSSGGGGSKVVAGNPALAAIIEGNPAAKEAVAALDQYVNADSLYPRAIESIEKYLTTGDRSWIGSISDTMPNRSIAVTGDHPEDRMARSVAFQNSLNEKYHAPLNGGRLPEEQVSQMVDDAKARVIQEAAKMKELYPEASVKIDKEVASVSSGLDRLRSRIVDRMPSGSVRAETVPHIVNSLDSVVSKAHWFEIGESANLQRWHNMVLKTLPKWKAK